MRTSETEKCGRCGAAIPAFSTEDLCPACLLSVALDPGGDSASQPSLESVLSTGDIDFPFEFGGYRLLRLLGRGGMGTVYEAEYLSDGRRVALKMLGQHLDSPDIRKRFLREGRLAARVNHPNSLYVFGSEEVDGLPVITMEIAGSGTLKDQLKKRGPLPVTEAVDAILDVISGLESAFQGGVLHRDVKPSNCFVGPDGSVKVGDFGLSVSTLASTDTFVTVHGRVLGTPAYASPEQLLGDTLDLRADIYSVGATLFTLLTNRAPFEGFNAVQIVANAVNKKPLPLSELRDEIPAGLERVVSRCLAKEREARYADYAALRNALLPFSSRVPEPASMKIRAQAGWIDYVIGFLIPYVILMFAIGNEQFHLELFVDQTLYSARYYLAFLLFGVAYFSVVEGIWGAGLGKQIMGLRVVRTNGQRPGIGRGLVRILIPVLSSEGIRIPLLLSSISVTHIDELTIPHIVLYSAATALCPCIPVLLSLSARRENGFATFWDSVSGTRVQVSPVGNVRSVIDPTTHSEVAVERAECLGPYQFIEDIVPGKWILGTDPVLDRQVWLLRRTSSDLAIERQNLGRPGRLRWLQSVTTDDSTWDAFEACQGVPFVSLIAEQKRLPWTTLRHWLHDIATELWASAQDQTLPPQLSLDHVWIATQGHAVLLDDPWPGATAPSEQFDVSDLLGQQHFLSSIASWIESTSLPLHARPVLQNLRDGKFEKLSFLTGILRSLLDKSADVSKGTRAGSIFILPLFVWIMFFVGTYTGEGTIPDALGDSLAWHALNTAALVLIAISAVQLLVIPFQSATNLSVYRLAVVDENGEPAHVRRLLRRWAVVWLPLLFPLALAALLLGTSEFLAFGVALTVVLSWLGAALYTVFNPNRGLQDRLANTWIVRC